MKKIILYGLVVILSMGLSSCGNKHKKDFNRLLIELADADKTIDHQDWSAIEKYLDSQKEISETSTKMTKSMWRR